MSTNTEIPRTADECREQFNPATNLSPEEVGRAMGTLSSDGFEQVNQMSEEENDIETADRVLVSLDAELAELVQRRAWECERDPEAVIDAYVKHGFLPHEEIMDGCQ